MRNEDDPDGNSRDRYATSATLRNEQASESSQRKDLNLKSIIQTL